jgi:hypothetical protein
MPGDRADMGLLRTAGKQSGRIFIENGRFRGQVAVDEIARRFSAS